MAKKQTDHQMLQVLQEIHQEVKEEIILLNHQLLLGL